MGRLAGEDFFGREKAQKAQRGRMRIGLNPEGDRIYRMDRICFSF